MTPDKLAEDLRLDFIRFAQKFSDYDLADKDDMQYVHKTLMDLALDAYALFDELRSGLTP